MTGPDIYYLDLLTGLEHQYGVSLSHDDDDDDDDGVVVREQCWDLKLRS